MEGTEGVEKSLQVVLDLMIGEAKNPVAEGLEIGLPVEIVGDLGRLVMDRAIQLQNEP